MLRKTAASGDSTALGRLWAVSRARLAATPSCRKPLSAVGTSTLAPFDCTEAAPRSIAAQPAMPAGSTSSRMRACAPDASAPAPAPPFVLSNNSGDTPCFSAACMSCSSHLSASRSAAFAAPGAASGSRRSPSSTISATSHSLSVLRVLARFLLPSAPSSSIPAVSNSFAGPKSCSSIRATLTSAVVPGVASTMLVSCRVIALIAVDFPAFMTPNTPMLMRCTSEPRSVDGCRGCTAAGADAGADGGAELQNARMALLPPSSPPQRRVWTRDVVWSRGRPAEPWSGRAPVAGLLREVRATGHAKV
mmetsp:Transcript_30724/g.91100  ORF Transcript_30724/g.91100 Transcript_30724/m.91100 type:complete len:305 (+) Transcript_30724:601-1515(+)